MNSNIFNKLSTVPKYKKYAVAVIFLLVIVCGYYAGKVQSNKEYYTSASYYNEGWQGVECEDIAQCFKSSQSRLYSLEFMFNEVVDKTGVLYLRIYQDEELIYKTDLSLANVTNMEWKQIYVNIPLKEDVIYTITLSPANASVSVPEILVSRDSSPEVVGTYIHGKKDDRNLVIKYGYLKEKNSIERIESMFVWLMIGFIVSACVIFSRKIHDIVKKGRRSIETWKYGTFFLIGIEALLCTIIINKSGLKLENLSKIILYSISVLVYWRYKEKRKYVDYIADSKLKKSGLFFIYFYFAYALVGQRLFVYPLNAQISIKSLFIYLSTVMWCVPVAKNVLYLYGVFSKYAFGQKKMPTWKFVMLCITALLIPAIYLLYVLNPGITNPDTYSTMVENAPNLRGMLDWHPAFYCMVLRIIENIWNSTYAVIIFHYLMWVYVLLEFLLFLREQGYQEKILIGAAAFSGLNVANALNLDTIWKDTPYAICVLWVVVILVKLVVDCDTRKRWYIYIELVVALVSTCLYRKNGIITYIVIAMGVFFLLRKSKRVQIAILVSVVAIVMIKGPVYSYLDIRSAESTGMYIGLGQDVLGVYYADGKVSEQTLKMVNQMVEFNNAEYEYNATWSNQQQSVDVSISEFIFNYIDTFIKNPSTMMRAIICRNDVLWNIYEGENAILKNVNYIETQDGEGIWNVLYPERKYVRLYPVTVCATNYIAESQWTTIVFWRCGLFLLLGIIMILFLAMVNEEKSWLVVLIPVCGHIISLLLTTGWSEFRYFWPVNLLSFAFVLCGPIFSRKLGIANNKLEMIG